jgi:hypothetical protein
MNPGRYWTFDRMTAFTAGETVDFNGIKAQWGATMTPQDVQNILGSKPFSVGRIKRDTEWFYMKGKPAYMLRTPEGKVWVLQVYTKARDPSLSMAGNSRSRCWTRTCPCSRAGLTARLTSCATTWATPIWVAASMQPAVTCPKPDKSRRWRHGKP